MSFASIARSMARESLSSSTRIGSVVIPTWNLISSRAWMLVGSETARYRRFARRKMGSAWCRVMSFSSTRRITSGSGSMAWMSTSGTPNSWEAACAMSWALASLWDTT